GSGLSRNNLFCARALRTFMENLYRRPTGALYASMLPRAGRSGTLASRFKGTIAEGILYAKTGSLSSVFTLSGYILPPLEQTSEAITFSILFEGSMLPGSQTRTVIDDIAVAFTEYLLHAPSSSTARR